MACARCRAKEPGEALGMMSRDPHPPEPEAPAGKQPPEASGREDRRVVQRAPLEKKPPVGQCGDAPAVRRGERQNPARRQQPHGLVQDSPRIGEVLDHVPHRYCRDSTRQHGPGEVLECASHGGKAKHPADVAHCVAGHFDPEPAQAFRSKGIEKRAIGAAHVHDRSRHRGPEELLQKAHPRDARLADVRKILQVRPAILGTVLGEEIFSSVALVSGNEILHVNHPAGGTAPVRPVREPLDDPSIQGPAHRAARRGTWPQPGEYAFQGLSPVSRDLPVELLDTDLQEVWSTKKAPEGPGAGLACPDVGYPCCPPQHTVIAAGMHEDHRDSRGQRLQGGHAKVREYQVMLPQLASQAPHAPANAHAFWPGAGAEQHPFHHGNPARGEETAPQQEIEGLSAEVFPVLSPECHQDAAGRARALPPSGRQVEQRRGGDVRS